jgi:hypothetical protein
MILSFAPGDAWSGDSRFSLKSFKEIVDSVKGSLSSFKDKITPSKEKIDSVKEGLSSVKDKLTPSKEKVDSLKKHISLDNRLVYEYRSVGGEEDTDFYEYWNLRGRDFFSGRLDFYFSGRLHKDLDDTTQSVSDNPFAGITDRKRSWEDQVYQLYANLKVPKYGFGLRLGRQYIDDVGWLHVDGGLLRIYEKKKISGSVFLGRPVSYYSSVSDDFAGGYSVTARPWYGGRARLIYVYYNDDRGDVSNGKSDVDMWQRVGDRTRVHGNLSFIDSDFLAAGFDVFYTAQDGLYDVLVKLKRSGELGDESREYSPLFGILGKREEFTFLSARSNIFLKSWLTVSPGISLRRVDSSSQDYRNRQYENYDLTVNITHHKHFNTSLSGNYWNVSDSDSFTGLTGQVNYHPSKVWDVTVGTAYLAYEYHADTGSYTSETSPDAYTLFANTKIKLTKSIKLKVELESEDNSSKPDDYFRFRTSLITRF